MELNLGFLASGRGTNVETILRNIEKGELVAKPKVIITNNPDSEVLEIAKDRNIPAFCVNNHDYLSYESVDEAIEGVLKKYGANLVVLAGYMNKIGKKVIRSYPNRILNIHPALLPKYGGKGMCGDAVHKAVIESNDPVSGATVHIVNEEYDSGTILAQNTVPRFADDTPEVLAKRVLTVEHRLYTDVLKEIQQGIIKLY